LTRVLAPEVYDARCSAQVLVLAQAQYHALSAAQQARVRWATCALLGALDTPDWAAHWQRAYGLLTAFRQSAL